MKVIRSKVLGFCMGVRRAVALAETEGRLAQAAAVSPAENDKNSPRQVFTLGPLIHNPKVQADFKKLGIEAINEKPQNLKNCTVIIRAHGIEPEIENELRDGGVHIIDATCPNVKINQLKAEELANAGYFLFLAGDKDHAEIKGISGFAQAAAGGSAFYSVVKNAPEAAKEAGRFYRTNNDAKTALIAQTTIPEESFLQISEAIKTFFPNLEVIQTICSAAKDRQDALRELIEEVDAVIIIGGRESANTGHLFAIAQESGKPCAFVESADEIPSVFKTYETVGLSAGASTPDSVIDEAERELLR